MGSIELGHATDNTLTAAGGDLSIEGNRIFRIGGADVPPQSNIIEYLTFNTLGDSKDFGDLTQARGQPSAFSDVHGGLG